jgi:hypothetical protein
VDRVPSGPISARMIRVVMLVLLSLTPKAAAADLW